MAWIDWSDELGVEIPEIDADHKKILEHLNVLFAASMAGVGDEMLDEVFREMRKFVALHFDHEFATMSKLGCSEADQHHEKHDHLLIELDDLEARAMEETGSGFSIDVVTSLRSWLIGHIAEDVAILRKAQTGVRPHA
jgi:hemerythrin